MMDYKDTWEKILTRLAPIIGQTTILSFFKNTIIASVDNNVMTIGVPTQIASSFLKQRHEVKVLQVVKEFEPSIKELKFEVMGSLADSDHPHKIDFKKFHSAQTRKQFRKAPGKQEIIMEGGIRSKMFNPKYTLDNYIPGQENRLAHAACLAVANKPGTIYNPLYLYGGVGLGKTHLLQGVGLEILKNHPDKNVVYMTSEKFINEIIDAIGKKHTNTFKEKYRKVDCLIVDDIQFFGNKATTQQEFFHTFNELYDNSKQIILSSDKQPRELDGLEERLKSRFGMGMVVEVLLPDYETRLAILNSKCKESEVLVDPEVLEFIAFNVQNSVRELEGILIKANAEAKLTETTPTIKSVAQAIRQMNGNRFLEGVKEEYGSRVVAVRTADDVIDIVAKYFKLTRSDLVGELRKKEVMIPRQICMFLIREVLDFSYETIGESFSGRNHTTVMHACNKIITQMNRDGRLKRDINAIKSDMGV